MQSRVDMEADIEELQYERDRLAKRLEEETQARNALEGDRTELQAKVGHLEQKLQTQIGARDYWAQRERADGLVKALESIQTVLEIRKADCRLVALEKIQIALAKAKP